MIPVEKPGSVPTGWDMLVVPTIIDLAGGSSSASMSLSGTPLSQLPSATLSECSDVQVQN